MDKLTVRRDKLQQLAIDRYLDEGFNIWDYLSADETLEYERILYKLGESDYNPDEK